MNMQKQTKTASRWKREGAGTPHGAKGDRESRERSRRTAGTETRITESQCEGERETGTFLFLITDSGSLCTLPLVKPETLTFLKELLGRQRQTERQVDRRTGRWALRN